MTHKQAILSHFDRMKDELENLPDIVEAAVGITLSDDGKKRITDESMAIFNRLGRELSDGLKAATDAAKAIDDDGDS